MPRQRASKSECDFKNHPFKVQADSQMKELQESIKKYAIGVICGHLLKYYRCRCLRWFKYKFMYHEKEKAATGLEPVTAKPFLPNQ